MANKNPNTKGLKPINTLSDEERKVITKKGAEASNKKQAEKKAFKEILESLAMIDIERFTTDESVLDELNTINPEFAQKIDVKSVIAARIIHKALKGDLYAIGFLRDTIGEKPVDRQEISGDSVSINFNRDYE